MSDQHMFDKHVDEERDHKWFTIIVWLLMGVVALIFTCAVGSFVMLTVFPSTAEDILLFFQPAPPVELNFQSVDKITIDYNWMSLSPNSPTDVNHVIEQAGKQYHGQATFSVGSLPPRHTSFTVPPQAVQDFLDTLQKARFERGSYQPIFDHTDDYPEIIIRLYAQNQEVVEFYSSSQGPDYMPWRVMINDLEYVLNSPLPSQAYDALKPYIHYDVLDDMINNRPQP